MKLVLSYLGRRQRTKIVQSPIYTFVYKLFSLRHIQCYIIMGIRRS